MVFATVEPWICWDPSLESPEPQVFCRDSFEPSLKRRWTTSKAREWFRILFTYQQSLACDLTTSPSREPQRHCSIQHPIFIMKHRIKSSEVSQALKLNDGCIECQLVSNRKSLIYRTSRALTQRDQYRQACATASLELQYLQSCKSLVVIDSEERARRLKSQLLLLELEKDEIINESEARELDTAQKATEYDRLATQLRQAQEEVQKLRAEILQSSEGHENLKSELKAAYDQSAGINTLKTEKLAVSRELASLKPEIEHLRTQAISHKQILTEKLALDRKVDALELEVEKLSRSLQRATNKAEVDSQSQKKADEGIGESKAELAKEKRERQKLEKQVAQMTLAAESQKTLTESRLDVAKSKAKSLRDQLLSCQAELQKTQTELDDAKDGINRTNNTARARQARGPQKRSAAALDGGAQIGTPGGLPHKKRKTVSELQSIAPGEKSMFSMTPFVNKTKAVGDTTSFDMEAASPSRPHPSSKIGAKPRETNGDLPNDKGVLSKRSDHQNNARESKTKNPTLQALLLDKVTEEQEQEQEEDEGGNPAPSARTSIPARPEDMKSMKPARDSTASEFGLLKKKRKILGGANHSTLFDTNDTESTKRSTLLGGSSRLGLLGRGGGGGGGGGLGDRPAPRAFLIGAGPVKPVFSPLKKDRRIALVR